MAERQKTQKNNAGVKNELLEMKKKREREQMIAEKRENIKTNRTRLEEHMREAVDKYIEYAEKYGEDDLRTRFQAMTIMLIEPMTQVIEVVLTLEDTMSIIDEALGIVEDTMGIIENIIDPKNHQKVGFFGRMKTKWRMKRYMNVWKGKIKQLGVMMGGMMKGAEDMTRTMAGMMGGMSNKKGGSTGVGLNPKALKMVNERKRELGMDTTDAPTGDAGTPTGGAPAGGAPTGGMDGGPGGLDGLI